MCRMDDSKYTIKTSDCNVNVEQVDGNYYSNSNEIDSDHYGQSNLMVDKYQADDSKCLTKSLVTNVDDSCWNINDSRSQAVYMTTTVPQNIKTNNIMGRHTPTRNSLRHSRMIVISNGYRASRKKHVLLLRHAFIARKIVFIELLFGIALLCLSGWIMIWAPNTRPKDNPYWSGLTLLLSSLIALLLVNFKRAPRNQRREMLFKILGINSAFISITSAILLFAAIVFAASHLIRLANSESHCFPHNSFMASSSCTCWLDVRNDTVKVRYSSLPDEDISSGRAFHYKDLSCDEVNGPWKEILIASTVLNTCGLITSVIYIILLFYPAKRKNIPKAIQKQPAL